MPPLQTKVEGSGNGIKTVIPNITDIATRINRDVEYPMKYFCNDIGAHTKLEDAKWIVMGNHTRERLQKSLFDYILRFVLCKHCRNPETTTIVDERKNIILRCGACGKEGMIEPKEKLNNFILKKETVTRSSASEPAKKDKKEKKEKKEKRSKTEKEEEDYEKGTRAEGKKFDIDATAEEAEKPDPVTLLKSFMAENPTEADLIDKVSDIKIEYGLREKDLMRLLGESLFVDETFLKKIRPYAPVFRRFVSEGTEKYIIDSLEILVFENKELTDKFPIAMKKLYDTEVVTEDTINAWYQSKPHKMDKEHSALLREKSKPFIDWLQDEEDDD
eukprot:gene18170-28002_t